VLVNVYGACSRDPVAYEAPDEFRVDRDWGSTPHHFGFGWGIHFCLGAHLAREEIDVGVSSLYRRLRAARVPEGFEPRQVSAAFLRGWESVPLQFDRIEPSDPSPRSM
jgi:cholest-4-en-3-one 26-monooxygenase